MLVLAGQISYCAIFVCTLLLLLTLNSDWLFSDIRCQLYGHTQYLSRCVVWAIMTLISQPPEGHMMPLGSHRPPRCPGVDVVTHPPSPVDFYLQYVLSQTPVILRGMAHSHTAYHRWNDDYLKENYGTLMVNVESNKKECRSAPSLYMSVSDFVGNYSDSGQYVVDSVHEEMYGELSVLSVLNCGPLVDIIVDVVLWWSSGSTQSVLHADQMNNIICQLDGNKRFLLVDKRLLDKAELDQQDGLFSSLDVDHVDLFWYKGITELVWYNVTLEAGDCLYIPYMWPHQVTSSRHRNMAVNMWFLPPHHTSIISQCNSSTNTCQHAQSQRPTLQHVDPPDSSMISQNDIILMAEQVGSMTQFMFDDIYGPLVAAESTDHVFQQLDTNADGIVTSEEMYEHDNARFMSMFPLFEPSLPGY